MFSSRIHWHRGSIVGYAGFLRGMPFSGTEFRPLLIKAFAFSEPPTLASSGNCPALVRKWVGWIAFAVGWPFSCPNSVIRSGMAGEVGALYAKKARLIIFKHAGLFGSCGCKSWLERGRLSARF